jgi:hypothetical protein
VGAVLAVGWASGCSVIYDLDTKQCQQTADCVALGGNFTDYQCIENLCQEPTGCRSNAECMDNVTTGVAAVACIDRQCVPLLTEQCPTMLPQSNDQAWQDYLHAGEDDPVPVILAGMGVLNGAPNFDIRLQNYDLALTELNTTVGGLPGSRPVVMIGCNADVDNDDELDAMMTHLADTAKVPGVVSALTGENLQRAFTTKGKDARMFFMSAVESDPALAGLTDDGLLWHVGPGGDVLARAYAPLVKRTITHLGLTSDVRIAVVVASTTRFLNGMLSTISGRPDQYGLFFNGKSSAENGTEGNYLSVVANEGQLDMSQQIADLITFKPHIVISAANQEFLTAIVPGLEEDWPVPDSEQPKPFYLLSPVNIDPDRLNPVLSGNTTLHTRMLGVNWPAAEIPDVYNAYLNRLRTQFGQTVLAGYENYYDAAYYLLYATAGAIPGGLQDGISLARGMGRLLSGQPINVGNGPNDMSVAMQLLLQASGSITLNGTLGPPDFNPTSGTRQIIGSVWCIDANRNPRVDVLRFQAAPDNNALEASFTGTMPPECMSSF